MFEFLKRNLIYPAFWFVFEFIGDRPWLAAIIVGLIAILVWRFLWPVVRGFHQLFGWKGWALLAAAVVTAGAFGAGWRAHRDSVLDPKDPEYHGKKPVKPKPKKPLDVDDEDGDKKVLFPGLDDFFKKVFKGGDDTF